MPKLFLDNQRSRSLLNQWLWSFHEFSLHTSVLRILEMLKLFLDNQWSRSLLNQWLWYFHKFSLRELSRICSLNSSLYESAKLWPFATFPPWQRMISMISELVSSTFLWIQRMLVHMLDLTAQICFSMHTPMCLDMKFNGPYLPSTAYLTVVVLLHLSFGIFLPRLGRFWCFKGLELCFLYEPCDLGSHLRSGNSITPERLNLHSVIRELSPLLP